MRQSRPCQDEGATSTMVTSHTPFRGLQLVSPPPPTRDSTMALAPKHSIRSRAYGGRRGDRAFERSAEGVEAALADGSDTVEKINARDLSPRARAFAHAHVQPLGMRQSRPCQDEGATSRLGDLTHPISRPSTRVHSASNPRLNDGPCPQTFNSFACVWRREGRSCNPTTGLRGGGGTRPLRRVRRQF